eukprot:Rhum_TRINITY_DN14578_c5_g2::Rhum_TRINITY_DN14578_c5_g2_i1::g.98475::m.98475
MSDASEAMTPEHAALAAEHAALVKKTDDWKAKVKQLTTKDRLEIARLREEVEPLTLQIKSLHSILKDKDGEIKRRQDDVENMRRTMEEVEGKATAMRSMQETLNSALGDKATVLETLKKRENEVVELRQRIVQLTEEVGQQRGAVDGAAYFGAGTKEALEELRLLKRVTHGASQWCLCASPTLPARWFEIDYLRSRFSALQMDEDLTNRLPCIESEEVLRAHTEKTDGQLQRLKSLLQSAQDETQRVTKAKQAEIDVLVQRIESLHSHHKLHSTREKENEESRRDLCRAELQAELEERYSAQLRDARDDADECRDRLRVAEDEAKRVAKEFAAYQARARGTARRAAEEEAAAAAAAAKAAAAAGDQRRSSETVAADLETCLRELEALKEKNYTLEETLRSTQAKCNATQSEMDKTSARLAEACSAAEASEREKHEALRELAHERAKAEAHHAADPRCATPLAEVDASAAASSADAEADDVAAAAAAPPPSADACSAEACAQLRREHAQLADKYAACRSALVSMREEMRQLAEDGARREQRSAAEPQPQPQPQPQPHDGGEAASAPADAAAVVEDTAAAAPEAAVVDTAADDTAAAAAPVSAAEGAAVAEEAAATLPPSCSAASLLDDETLGVGGEFEMDDLVTALDRPVGAAASSPRADLENRVSWLSRKLARVTHELSEARDRVHALRGVADENVSLRAVVEELQRSVARLEGASALGEASADYLKNTVLNFCLAKEKPEVQAALVHLLASLLQLSEAEVVSLVELYPPY